MVYAFLAEGFEEIEALATVDLLRRADIEVKTVGIGGKTIAGSHGIPVVADLTEYEVREADIEMLILPGGMPGTLHLNESAFVRSMVQAAFANGVYIAAICAAPSVLGTLGLLEGRRAVCYPGQEEKLRGAALQPDAEVVCDGKIITAKAAGVACDFALKLIELLCGYAQAEKVRKGIFYHARHMELT